MSNEVETSDRGRERQEDAEVPARKQAAVELLPLIVSASTGSVFNSESGVIDSRTT
ncbi:hypothetical protein GCM10022207_67230 [Streptomyces lannensis]|uniref:Uncharacterized protein n=1 Tax=Streptomyces lannensis TaxID=766498 RepID=A0ABP7KYK6_9ACTN